MSPGPLGITTTWDPRPEAGTPRVILLVEDNPADVRLAREALRSGGTGAGPSQLLVASNGFEALDALHRRGAWEGAPRPDLVLLDLNMPRKGGLEVLQEVKRDPALATIPVVVFTSSQADEDVLRAYQSHANCYVNKPIDFAQFASALCLIESFWLSLATLPSEG